MIGSTRVVQASLIRSASLTITPTSGSYANGQVVTLTIYVNSGNYSINAVESDLIYNPSFLTFGSISTSTGAFSITAAASGSNGLVNIAVGSTTPVTGSQIVATVTFTTIGPVSSTPIKLASSSSIVRSSDNRNIWNGNITDAVASYSFSS
jgi:hypothetical protein